MRSRVAWIMAVLALAIPFVGIAQGTTAFNLMVSDQNTGLIDGFTEVRIYAIDPVTEERLEALPVMVLNPPKNPIQVLLDPGRYELVVWMFYLPKEVPYFQFTIEEDETNLIDLLLIDMPSELVTY